MIFTLFNRILVKYHILVGTCKRDEILEHDCLHCTVPYAAFIESVENSDIIRLRVHMLLESGCRELANNLISWCVASRMFDCDIYILLRRLDFLHASDRAEEFHQLVGSSVGVIVMG